MPLLTLGLAGLLSGGCGSEDLPDVGTEAAHSFGLMSVNYTHDWQSGTTEQRGELELTTTAQFVRYSALDRPQVSRLLALPLDPATDLPPVDSCKLYDLTVDLGEQSGLDQGSETANVELLEAGDLRVSTSGTSVKLEPRHFPGLLPFISGVVYSEVQSDSARRAGRVSVSASGGETVGAFQVEAASPALPRVEALAGEQPQGEATLRAGDAIDVRWSASTVRDEVFYLEARYPAAKRDLVLRCTPRDDGRFTIGAPELAKLGAATKGNKLVVELARMRRSTFAARGLDQGELRVSVRDRAGLIIR